ncbi:MAG: hypothetical protein WBG76_16330 [Ornithinimicrobium sp.]
MVEVSPGPWRVLAYLGWAADGVVQSELDMGGDGVTVLVVEESLAGGQNTVHGGVVDVLPRPTAHLREVVLDPPNEMDSDPGGWSSPHRVLPQEY